MQDILCADFFDLRLLIAIFDYYYQFKFMIMKKLVLFVILAFLFINSFAQSYSTYSGKIGTFPITLFIKATDIVSSEGYETGIKWSGYYYYNSVKQNIKLEGEFDAMGQGGADEYPTYYIYEYNNGHETGYFATKDYFTDSKVVKGTWANVSGTKKYQFYLSKP